ncbi:MAG TPA: hypothetical protein VF109_01295 [Mycobacteriales bacterium]
MWGRPTRSATAGFDGINLVTGLVLVVVVLLFRRGLLGTARHWPLVRRRGRHEPRPVRPAQTHRRRLS